MTRPERTGGADAFVSYAREDVKFVEKLTRNLASADVEVWVDQTGIPPSAEWMPEIERAIEAASTFVFIISPDSLESSVCQTELSHAVHHGKRLVPVLSQDVQESRVPPSLQKLHWVSFRDGTFDESAARVIEAIQTDLAHARAHSRLLTQAIEWERSENRVDHLLRGVRLIEAEELVALSDEREPKTTPLQGRFVLASRVDERSRQRKLLTGVSAALIVAIALAALAFYLYRQSEARRSIALSRQLAAQAALREDRDPDRALLLSVEAWDQAPTAEARGALLARLLTTTRLRYFLHGHRANVQEVVYSRTGRIAAADNDGRIVVWDSSTAQPETESFQAHSGILEALAFDEKGRLASGGWDGRILLWNTDEAPANPSSTEIAADAGIVQSIAFRADGKLLASGSLEGNLSLWSVGDHRRVASYELPSGITGVAFVGRNVVACGLLRGEVALFDVERGQPVMEPLHGDEERLLALALSPDGRMLASGGMGQTIRIWELSGDDPILEQIVSTQERVLDLDFAPDSRTLAAAIGNGTINLFDARAGTLLANLEAAHSGKVNAIAFSPDGESLVSAGAGGRVAVWNVAGMDRATDESDLLHDGWAIDVEFSRDGARAFSVGLDATLVVHDRRKRTTARFDLGDEAEHLSSLAVAPDGETLALGASGGRVLLWSPRQSALVGRLSTGADSAITDLAFVPSTSILVGSTDAGRVHLWSIDAPDRASRSTSASAGSVQCITVHPSGHLVATGDNDGMVRLWRLPSLAAVGEPLRADRGAVSGLSFRPDGETLAAAGDSGSLTVWELKGTQAVNPSVRSNLNRFFTAAYSPDGSLLATGDETGSLILWDASTTQPIGPPLAVHTDFVLSLAFDASGRTLATAGGDGAVHFWDVDPQSWQARLCEVANRDLTSEEWSQHIDGVEYRKTCAANRARAPEEVPGTTTPAGKQTRQKPEKMIASRLPSL